MDIGPQPITQNERRVLLEQIIAQIRAHYGDQVLALGVYGSLARDLDGPFSDIEIHCVVQGENIDTSHEWTAGPWKSEVDVYSADVLLRDAAEIDGNWAMTHGAFVFVKPLYDPESFFAKLRQVTLSQPDKLFEKMMHLLIVGEIYEMIGKIRNTRVSGETSALVLFTAHLAMYGAWLLGLAHRHLFTTVARMLPDALNLDDRPLGFDEICHLVIGGDLVDHARVYAAADAFWDGIVEWAEKRGIEIVEDLGEILNSS